eukprot:jgi/Bigna1/136703/aug1.35_g11411
MSVSQFLGKDDWKVSVQDGGTCLVSGNQTSNKDKIASEKVKQLENHLKCWKGNLKHELKKREEDVSKFVSQLSDESVTVDGMSFKGHSLSCLRKCGDEATVIAVAQAEIQLSDSVQTLHNKTTEEIARLRNEHEKANINDEERQHNLIAEELKRKRLIGRMKKGKHKAEMLVSAYIVERLDDLTVEKSVDIRTHIEERRKKAEAQRRKKEEEERRRLQNEAEKEEAERKRKAESGELCRENKCQGTQFCVLCSANKCPRDCAERHTGDWHEMEEHGHPPPHCYKYVYMWSCCRSKDRNSTHCEGK